MCGLLQVSSPAPAPPPCCPARAPASTARRWWCRRSASGWWPRPPAPPSPSRWTPAPSPTVSSPVTGSWSRLHGVSTPRCCSELRRVAAAPVDGGQDDGGAGERGPHVRPGRQEGVHRPQVQCSTCSTVQYSAVQCGAVTALCVQEFRQDPPHRGVQPPPAPPQLQPRLEHLRASAARQPPVRGQTSQSTTILLKKITGKLLLKSKL